MQSVDTEAAVPDKLEGFSFFPIRATISLSGRGPTSWGVARRGTLGLPSQEPSWPQVRLFSLKQLDTVSKLAAS